MKPYYFSRVLRQICKNLVTKNFQKESSGRGILPGQLASKRENKNVGVKKMIFPPYLNMGA